MTNKSSKSDEKTCFIISPLGADDSETRRSIDGLIQAVLIPAIQDDFNVIAPHHIDAPLVPACSWYQ